MEKDSKKDLEISELVFKSLDGSISQTQFDQLQNYLAADRKAVNYYVDYLLISARLREHSTASIEGLHFDNDFNIDVEQDLWKALAESERTAARIEIDNLAEDKKSEPKPDSPLERKTVKQKREVSKPVLFTAIGSIAALLIMLAYVYFNPRQFSPIVATLTEVVDAKWNNPALPITPGSELRSGTMELAAGYVLITFDSGAELIVEAPAELEAISMHHVFLRKGKLTANVPTSAIGFTIKTPNAKVVDLGTEFGIIVNESGCSDIHVFDGEVALCPNEAENQDENTKRHLIKEGHAKRVDTEHRVSSVEFVEKDFVRQEEFEISLKAWQGSNYHRWLLYSNKLRRDPYLTAYYTFENNSADSRNLVNVAETTKGKLNTVIEDNAATHGTCNLTEGRWPQKKALEFDRSLFDYIVIPYDPVLDINNSLTIAAWVLRKGSSGGGHILTKREEYTVNYQFGFFGELDFSDKGNRLEFGKGLPQPEPYVFTSRRIQEHDVWQHVAVTCENNLVRFYLDGKLIGTTSHENSMILSTTDLLIGTDGLENDPTTFNGLMDEIAIFKRVLTSEEIRQMYENGIP